MTDVTAEPAYSCNVSNRYLAVAVAEFNLATLVSLAPIYHSTHLVIDFRYNRQKYVTGRLHCSSDLDISFQQKFQLNP